MKAAGNSFLWWWLLKNIRFEVNLSFRCHRKAIPLPSRRKIADGNPFQEWTGTVSASPSPKRASRKTRCHHSRNWLSLSVRHQGRRRLSPQCQPINPQLLGGHIAARQGPNAVISVKHSPPRRKRRHAIQYVEMHLPKPFTFPWNEDSISNFFMLSSFIWVFSTFSLDMKCPGVLNARSVATDHLTNAVWRSTSKGIKKRFMHAASAPKRLWIKGPSNIMSGTLIVKFGFPTNVIDALHHFVRIVLCRVISVGPTLLNSAHRKKGTSNGVANPGIISSWIMPPETLLQLQ